MSIKLFAYFAGVLATIGGLVGTAYSLSGEKKDTSNNTTAPVGSWKTASTGPLEISLGCSQNADSWDIEKGDYTFKIRGLLSGDWAKELMEKNSTDIEVTFELLSGTKGEAIKKFSTKKESDIFTTIQYWNKGGLNITIGDLSGDSRVIESQDFWCKSLENEVKWLDNQEDKVIGHPPMKASGDTTLVGSLKDMKVIFDKCEKSDEGRINTCDLSLTDKSGLKLRIKAQEGVKFTFST